MYSFGKIIVVLSIVQAAMCNLKGGVAPEAKDFFEKTIQGNLTKITWAHAVNSKEKLQEALGNEKVMMLEGDVIVGGLNETSGNVTENVPVMAHPPEVISDLSLEEFLESVLANGKRGIKLDFKSIEAFNASRAILEKYRANLTVPVWLNADIVTGPVDANATDAKPVDPASFISGAAASFPESTLSIGWTTRYGSKYNITKGSYSQEDIRKMVEEVGRSKTKQPITYPIRAGLAANSLDVFTGLLKDTAVNKPTLTIWSSAGDSVDTTELSKFIKKIGVDKVYVDVPEDVWSKLNISGASSMAASSIMLIASLFASFVIAKFV